MVGHIFLYSHSIGVQNYGLADVFEREVAELARRRELPMVPLAEATPNHPKFQEWEPNGLLYSLGEGRGAIVEESASEYPDAVNNILRRGDLGYARLTPGHQFPVRDDLVTIIPTVTIVEGMLNPGHKAVELNVYDVSSGVEAAVEAIDFKVDTVPQLRGAPRPSVILAKLTDGSTVDIGRDHLI